MLIIVIFTTSQTFPADQFDSSNALESLGNHFPQLRLFILWQAIQNHKTSKYSNLKYFKRHGMTESVKVQRKDQSVERNAYFYYFGQFRIFLLYF